MRKTLPISFGKPYFIPTIDGRLLTAEVADMIIKKIPPESKYSVTISSEELDGYTRAIFITTVSRHNLYMSAEGTFPICSNSCEQYELGHTFYFKIHPS